MEDKYAILKKLAQQKAKDEIRNIAMGSLPEIEKSYIDLKLRVFEQEIVIEELKHDKVKVESLVSKYSGILNAISIGYIVCDINGTIIETNISAQKMFSLPPLDKAFGRPLSLSIAFEDRGRFLEWLLAFKMQEGMSQCQITSMSERILNIEGSRISRDEVLLSIIDISKNHKETLFLRLIKEAFDKANDAIIITDGDIKVIYANNAFSAITGYEKHEIIGHNPSILKSGIYGKEFYEKFWNDLLKQGSWSGQIADKTKSGKLSVHQTTITAIKNKGEITHYIAIFSDVTKHKEMSEKILEISIYDSLTRLPNRQMLMHKIEELCVAKHTDTSGFAVLFVDLDNFKYINDTFGHSSGDELLIEVAKRLKGCTRKTDTVARFGGDEFIIILEELKETLKIQVVADAIVSALQKDVRLNVGHVVNVSCSVGISVYPLDTRNHEELIKYADIAMYKAKDEGKNRYRFYNNEMSSQSLRISKLKNILKDAEKCGEIYLKYQPIVCAQTLQVKGLETLARWNNVHFGEIPPIEFIALAEQNGHIKNLGRWIIERSCEQIGKGYFKEYGLDELAINISGLQIKESDFITYVANAVKNGGLEPRNLLLEVTETMLIENLSLASRTLGALREMGFRIALDDFGTGFSSLSYLQKLPIDIVKIDKSFIDLILDDKKSMDIVRTIIDLSHCLGKEVIAEGIEHQEQCELLKEAGCDRLQGYLFSKPISPKYFVHHLGK